MELYIKVAIRTEAGIVEKKISMADIIGEFFGFNECGGINPANTDIWASLSVFYDEDLYAYKAGPEVFLRVAGPNKGAVVAMVKAEQGGMTPNRPEILIGGESSDKKVYPLAGVSLESLVGEESLRFRSRLEIGNRPAEKIGVMDGGIVAISDTSISGEERKTNFNVPTSVREFTEKLDNNEAGPVTSIACADVAGLKAKKSSKEEKQITDVYKMLDRDAIKADCVTKADIRERLVRCGEEDLFEGVDELSDEDVENGFYIVATDSSDAPYMALEVQRIDAIADLGIPGIPSTDEEAGERARRMGIPFINDIPGVDKDRFVDTPENRELVRKFYEERKRIPRQLQSLGVYCYSVLLCGESKESD